MVVVEVVVVMIYLAMKVVEEEVWLMLMLWVVDWER